MSEANFSCGYITECIKFQKVLYSPLKKAGFVPEDGSEVFVRQIPLDDTETDLLKFFQSIGEIFQIRLMVSDDGKRNRGFGYVTYFNAADAKKAVATLNSVPYKNYYFLTIENSLNNCRLFVGGIPTHKTKDQVWQELYSKGIKNIIDVIMYRSYSNRSENRGFVFVEFKTHEEAAYFRAKFAKCLKLWDHSVVVDWSIPIPPVDEEVMDAVKIVYLRNLDVCLTREDIQSVVLNFTIRSSIEKVYKFKNYAFIHLISREYAECLMERLKEYYRNTMVEVTWAKPPNKFTSQEYRLSKVSYLTSHLPIPKYSIPRKPETNPCVNCCSKFVEDSEVAVSPHPEWQLTQPDFVPLQTSPIATLQRQASTSSIAMMQQAHNLSFNSTQSSLSPYEDFCRELLRTGNTVQSTPCSKTCNVRLNLPENISTNSAFSAIKDPYLEIYGKRMRTIYNNTTKDPVTVLNNNDLEVIPKGMSLEEVQELTQDIFD